MFRRLLNLFRPNHLEADIREELEFHRSQTSGTFGNITLIQDRARDASTIVWLETLVQDIRYGFRQLLKTPAFFGVAVLSLALGIGANTAIFTLINAVMLQSLPVRDPGRLVLFYDGIETGVYSGSSFPDNLFSYPSWQYFKTHNDSFESLSAFRQGSDYVVMHVAGTPDDGPREQANVHLVSGSYFDVLGVNAAAGRVLKPEDDALTATRVGVISYAFWRDRFHLDHSVIGKVAILNGTALTIVGVAAPEFFGERVETPPDFWVPLSFQPQILQRESWLDARNVYWLNLIGRLKPGMTIRNAQAAVNFRLRQFYTDQAGAHLSPSVKRQIQKVNVKLTPGGSGISNLRFVYSEPLHVLMAVVGVVLLIACANLATLLLARASARRHEFLARLALGASRVRLVRQVLTESVLLSILGGVAGVAVAWWSVRLLIVLFGINSVVKVTPSALVLAFSFVISVLTGLIFGIIPAIRCSRMEARPATAVRSAEFGRNRFGSPDALIVLQISLSLVLLLVSGLLAHSFLEMEQQDIGFTRQNILVAWTDPRLAGYKPNELFPLYRAFDERLNRIPGVVSASLVNYTPESGTSDINNLSIQGYTPPAGKELGDLYAVEVGPHFFETLGMPLLFGRAIGPRDTPASSPVVVVNQTFVSTYLPNQNPIGSRICRCAPFQPPGAEIVGVVKDSKYYDLRDKPKAMAFFSVWQPQEYDHQFVYAGALLIRTSREPSTVVPEIRRALNNISSRLPAPDTTTLNRQIENSLYQQKVITSLSSVFGFLALLLASVGIYGTVAYSVARRTTEIGIRMAIGAQRRSVLWMIARDSALLIVIGLALGLPLALVGTRWIRSFLFGVATADPLAIAAAVLVIALLSLLAAYIPARRATKIDPMSALRHE